MREIKFRAWNPDWDEMVYSGLEILFDKREFYPFGFEVGFSHYPTEEWTIMQYTGLKDKNGKEIFEGDIIKYSFDLPESSYATEEGLKIRINKVIWSELRSSFSVGSKMANNDLFRYVRNGNRVEVIGNIYENPEFLEVKHE